MYLSYHPLSQCSLHPVFYLMISIALSRYPYTSRSSSSSGIVVGGRVRLCSLVSPFDASHVVFYFFSVLLYAFEYLFSSSKSARSAKFISFCLCCINHNPLIFYLLCMYSVLQLLIRLLQLPSSLPYVCAAPRFRGFF